MAEFHREVKKKNSIPFLDIPRASKNIWNNTLQSIVTRGHLGGVAMGIF